MTRHERAFRARMATDREEAVRAYFTLAVEEWLQEGPEEVVRILTLWATRDSGFPTIKMDDEELVEVYLAKTDPFALAGGPHERWAVYSGPPDVERTDLLSRSDTRTEAHEDARRGASSWIVAARRRQPQIVYDLVPIGGQGGWRVYRGREVDQVFEVIEEGAEA